MSVRDWKQELKKQSKKELLIIALLVVILIIGVICEIAVAFDRYIYMVSNYDEVSLAVIQVQATVFTLTIALVALLSGHITDEYLGVKYNHFILNIKPYYLKQKRLISLLLTLLVFNLFFHMLGYYNIVIAVFVVTVVLVAYSASAIYEAFAGTEQIEEEVGNYVVYSLANKKTQINVFNAFCEQWIKVCVTQENGDYEKYMEVFNKGFSELVKSDSSRAILLDRCTALLRQLLKKQETAVRGINTLKECYEQAWLFIRDNNVGISSPVQNVPFYLLENVYYELRDAIENMKVKDAEKAFHWGRLTELISLVDIYIGYNTEDPNKNSELRCLEEFGGFLGYYISPKCSRENVAERSNNIWGGPLSQIYNYRSLSDDLRNEAESVLANRNFRFMVAQIKYDNAELVKEYLYNRGIHDRNILCQPYALMVLKYHCYLYYLSEFETLDCISQELKDRAKSFLEDNQIMNGFRGFLLYVSQNDKNVFHFGGLNLDLLNNDLVNKLTEELRVFEFYPKNGDAKLVVMDYSVRQFVLFTVAFISNYYNTPELLNRVISEEQSIIYYIDFTRKKDCRTKLQRFLKLIGVKDNHIEDKTDACYTGLISYIRSKYKSYSIHKAEKSEKVLDKGFGKKREVFSARIKEYLESELKGIIGATEDEKCEAALTSISIFSDQEIESLLDGNYDWLFNQFVWVVSNKLYKDGKIKIVSRKTFSTDDDLLKYLNSHKDGVIIGSENVLMADDFRRRNEFIEVIHAAEHYTTGAHGLALVLKENSLKISITNVQVDKHIPAVNEIEAKHNRETDLYSYEVSSGMPVDFTREELQNYLNNTRRVLDIVIQFAIETADGLIGDVVEE